MKHLILVLSFCGSWYLHGQNPSIDAQQLLYKIKTGENYDAELNRLSNISRDSLRANLNTENMSKAFWINVYNAFIILKSREFPESYQNARNKFFKKQWITIAGTSLSFDAIEHGILRRSKNKLSRGYFNKCFYRISKFERTFRLDSLDYRIHFALNCGAVSCPPVAYYNSEKLEQELKVAELNFLTTDSKYDVENNTLHVSQIFSWFLNDFGGKKRIINLHKNLNIIPKDAKPKLVFKDYDWTMIY